MEEDAAPAPKPAQTKTASTTTTKSTTDKAAPAAGGNKQASIFSFFGKK